MKKNILSIFVLLLVSLACRALQAPVSTTTTIETGPASTALPTVASTSPELIATSTPHPAPPPVTCTDDSCLNACLQRINEALPSTSYEPLSGLYAGDNIDLNLVYYDVENGQLGEAQTLYVPKDFKAFQEDTVAHQNIWTYASGLLPPDKLDWLTGFEIFSSSTYAGWVSPSGQDETDRSHWILGIDYAYAQNPVDLTYTLVHEYGHLITLNTDQIPASDYYYGWQQNPGICPQFLAPDGCSTPNSYINLFYQSFWKDIFNQWLEEVYKPHTDTPDEFYALVTNFYNKHPDEFVRDYAAKNINEDLAESFMHFVLEPKPTGNGVIKQKIKFFYQFPELVEIRQTMIQSICSYTQ
ncbi:MAG: hypothetical protein U0Z26_00680 [Anaerolineales bacterium]